MWLAVFKLGGESKFGKQPQEEIKDLRARLLRAIAVSLVDTFEPILTLANSVEVPTLILPGNDEVRESPKITKLGGEKLLDAVRDFVKSDITLMKSLRSLDAGDSFITRYLCWLRVSIVGAGIVSGAFTLAAVGLKGGMAVISVDWPFVAAFALVAACLVSSAFFALRVMLAVNRFEALKDRHADLS
jgi:hypothetical protein